MFVHPQFNPVAVQLGPVAVRWYGLMYLAGFISGLLLGRSRIRSQPWTRWTLPELDDLLGYVVLGVILGGRLGYIVFYKASYYLAHPLEVFAVWQGGMSFHGGFLGVAVAVWLFSRRSGKPLLAVGDFVAPLAPLGLAFGRLGNFINGELPGRVTSVPWGMIFPQLHEAVPLPRHPSQLYECGLEGLTLFVLLWAFTSRRRPPGAACGMFLVLYGVFRFCVEFTREPDDFLGLLALGFSMGQWLSIPMVLAGIYLLRTASQRELVISA